jgi:hypothetical protein
MHIGVLVYTRYESYPQPWPSLPAHRSFASFNSSYLFSEIGGHLFEKAWQKPTCKYEIGLAILFNGVGMTCAKLVIA